MENYKILQEKLDEPRREYKKDVKSSCGQDQGRFSARKWTGIADIAEVVKVTKIRCEKTSRVLSRSCCTLKF